MTKEEMQERIEELEGEVESLQMQLEDSQDRESSLEGDISDMEREHENELDDLNEKIDNLNEVSKAAFTLVEEAESVRKKTAYLVSVKNMDELSKALNQVEQA